MTISKKTLQRIAGILCLIRDSDIVVLYFRFALETMATNRLSVALLRVTKGFAFVFLFNLCTYSVHLDLSELGPLPPSCQVTHPNQDDLLHFTLTITPEEVKHWLHWEKQQMILKFSQFFIYNRIWLSTYSSQGEMPTENLPSKYRPWWKCLFEYSSVGNHD